MTEIPTEIKIKMRSRLMSEVVRKAMDREYIKMQDLNQIYSSDFSAKNCIRYLVANNILIQIDNNKYQYVGRRITEPDPKPDETSDQEETEEEVQITEPDEIPERPQDQHDPERITAMKEKLANLRKTLGIKE